MTAPDETPEPSFDLVMPFVTVASKGGPHDDDAYVAGYEMGHLDAILSTGLPIFETTIHAVNTGQADLIAMKHRYQCRQEPSDEVPEWTYATFTRTSEHTP